MILNYECKFSNCLYSCEFEGKSEQSNPLRNLLTYLNPDKIINLMSQMKKDNIVITTECMVPEKDLELRKWLRMTIVTVI